MVKHTFQCLYTLTRTCKSPHFGHCAALQVYIRSQVGGPLQSIIIPANPPESFSCRVCDFFYCSLQSRRDRNYFKKQQQQHPTDICCSVIMWVFPDAIRVFFFVCAVNICEWFWSGFSVCVCVFSVVYVDVVFLNHLRGSWTRCLHIFSFNWYANILENIALRRTEFFMFLK